MPDDYLHSLLASRPERFARLLDDPSRFRLQIMLSIPERAAGGGITLRTHAFRADAEYFYPASTIKLCAAIAAMQTLRALQDQHESAEPGLHTPMLVHPLFADQSLEQRDETNIGPPHSGAMTVAHEIRKLCLVSDNPAHNRLYELVGHEPFHARMFAAGLRSLRVRHRLSNHRTPLENLRTARVDFLTRRGVITVPERTSTLDLPAEPIPGLHIGERHAPPSPAIDAVALSLIDGPMDFSLKNRISLADLHRLIIVTTRPEIDPALLPGADPSPMVMHNADRAFLLDAMLQYPAGSANPVYDEHRYPDHFGKFMLPGLARVWDRGDIRIWNKCGQAYGFSIENARVLNARTGAEFFLTAAIYTNASGTIGADTYDYATVAFPFFVHLGQALAETINPA